MQLNLLEDYKKSLVQYTSEHYIFSVQKDSFAEKNIISIIKLQEMCFKGFLHAFNVKSNLKIKYFLFASSLECGKQYRLLYPDEYNESDPDESINGYTYYPDTIFATYNEKVQCIGYHEDVHILMDEQFGDITSCFVKEGIAMSFDKDWWHYKNEYWAKIIVEKGLLENIETYYDNDRFFEYDDRYTYSLAGAFTSWLLEKIGLDAYKKYYSSFLMKESYPEQTYLKGIVEEFLKYISGIEIDKGSRSAIEKMIDKIEKSRNLTTASTL
jgi:hypothetical protein